MGCITTRYAETKPPEANAHNLDQLRKYWERMKAEIGRWQGLYENHMWMMGSGQNYGDVKELMMEEYLLNGVSPPSSTGRLDRF